MLTKVKGLSFEGLETREIDIEVSLTRGLPAFEIVGLANKAVEESKYRIKSAFLNSGLSFPDGRIVVNLAPADIHKTGSSYDLGIAVGLYCALSNCTAPMNDFFFGELSLDGAVKQTRGSYLALEYADKLAGTLYISEQLSPFFSDFVRATLYSTANLRQLFSCLFKPNKSQLLTPSVRNNFDTTAPPISKVTFADIIGQENAKRALTISAAGQHNVLLVGSPGTGKSMLARSFVNLLPVLTSTEEVEVRRIISYEKDLLCSKLPRPFRAPHHTISYAGMLGGGADVLPGEVTKAHKGVLFMDEFCEFSRYVLEALRQPLEDKYVSIVRNNLSYVFPSDFTLIAASNPCPCGYNGHATRACICSEPKLAAYRKKLSGPLADRIDIFVSVYPEEGFVRALGAPKSNQSCDDLKSLVAFVREKQAKRYHSDDKTNVLHLFKPDAVRLLEQGYKTFSLSPRGYIKVAKVSRTIADLAMSEAVTEEHVAEAFQYRQR